MITIILIVGLYGEIVRWTYNPPERPPEVQTVPVMERGGWIVDVPVMEDKR